MITQLSPFQEAISQILAGNITAFYLGLIAQGETVEPEALCENWIKGHTFRLDEQMKRNIWMYFLKNLLASSQSN